MIFKPEIHDRARYSVQLSKASSVERIGGSIGRYGVITRPVLTDGGAMPIMSISREDVSSEVFGFSRFVLSVYNFADQAAYGRFGSTNPS